MGSSSEQGLCLLCINDMYQNFVLQDNKHSLGYKFLAHNINFFKVAIYP